MTQDTFEEEIARRASTTRTENEEKVYTRNLIEVSLCVSGCSAKLMGQRPRFAYVEEDSGTRYEVRMAPKGGLDDDDLDIERPDSPPKEEAITRSATSTPEAVLVTPVSGAMRHMSVKEESPTPEGPKQKRGISQDDGSVEEDVKPKKRARVTFA